MSQFRPMKADNVLGKTVAPELHLSKIAELGHFDEGLFASYKCDGIRAVVRGGVVLSNSGKPIPSRYVQTAYRDLEGLDGELIAGPPNASNVYQRTFSAVMTHGCMEPVDFYVFDKVGSETYEDRWINTWKLVESSGIGSLLLLEQRYVVDPEAAALLESEALEAGYEGLILRRKDAPYKFGRSTLKEGYMLKLKRFEDAEAEIIGFEERMHNANEAKINELGYTKRSQHRDNKVGLGTLGAIRCRGINGKFEGVTFKIGIFKGYDSADLQKLWDMRQEFLGKICVYKFQQCGTKDAPRIPRLTLDDNGFEFKGLRAKEDL